MNQTLAHVLGGEPAQFRSRPWAEFILPDDRPEAEEKLRGLFEGGSRSCRLECRYLPRSGNPVWCSTALAPIRGAESCLEGVAALVSNLTERKWLEEANARLQQQLVRAQKMESLGMIAGGLAHDFNNFLEVILGFASLVKLHLPPQEEIQEPFRMIEESAKHAAGLATQLLELTHERISFQESSDPLEALRRVLKIIRRTFDRKIRIESRLESGLPWVRGDGQRLEQAVLNLAINARDAMPEGGTLLLGASRASVPPDDYVQIVVEDTGAGMEPEVLRHIFEPLFTTKPEGEGTGLGLAMVQKAVKTSGGFIDVRSKPGKGSHFLLYLPVVPAPRQSAAPPAPALTPGRGTVLVVDDEPMVRAFLEKGMKQLGYGVLAAESGLKACELYAAHAREIECVILDMVMPEMSGIETYERLKALNPVVKVILSSGYNRRSLGEGAPGADFLGKPYTIESLSAALKKIRGE